MTEIGRMMGLRASFRACTSSSSSLCTAAVRRKATAVAPLGRRLRVCVVGSGPAGFYVTKYLLKVSDYRGAKIALGSVAPNICTVLVP